MYTFSSASSTTLLAILFLYPCAIAQESPVSNIQAQEKKPTIPGPTKDGFLLPNGWHISPAGRQIKMNDLVLNIHCLKDGKHALATCDGFNEHYLGVFDLESGSIVSKETAYQSWFGLAVSERQNQVWWSGGGAGFPHAFDFKDLQLKRTSEPEPNVRAMNEEEPTSVTLIAPRLPPAV